MKLKSLPCLLLVACSWLTGCDRAPRSSSNASEPVAKLDSRAPATPWFAEVGSASGITFRHSSGHRGRFCMPEINTGGIALLDFDNDGLPDIFCVNGGSVYPDGTNAPVHCLYHNLGQWRFEDVTVRAGVGRNQGYGMGVACADFDNDGWTDIYVLNLRTNILYRNRGDGTFEDVTTRAGVGGDEWSSSAAFFDYDGDGYPDLFVVNYIHWSLATELECYSRGGVPDYCSPQSYHAPARDRLYHNRGDGTFEDVTHAMGVDHAFGNGLGVATGDFDHDGRVDVFVANDAMPNQLWLNHAGGSWEDDALRRGCALNAVGIPRAGMGVVAVDLQQRGWLDLFVTHLAGEGNGWFSNTRGYFVDLTTPRGPMQGSWPYTGFGVGFRDFDHDGELDLFVANGRVRLGVKDLDASDPYAEPNSLLRGLGGGDFAEVLPQGGTQPVLLSTGRGAAFGDLDNDGAEDIVVINRDGPIHLLKNLVGGQGRWLGLDVRTTAGHVARNAMVRVAASGRTQYRQVQPNEGYASSNDPRVVFGLGSATAADQVLIRWADGSQESFGALQSGRYHVLTQSHGSPATKDLRFDW